MLFLPSRVTVLKGWVVIPDCPLRVHEKLKGGLKGQSHFYHNTMKLLVFFILFHKHMMGFSRGFITCVVTTGQLQKQIEFLVICS
jgi:hypothetical protein